MNQLSNITNIILASSIGLYLLIIGKNLLIPLIIAVVIWYLIISITHVLERHKLPHPLALTLAILLCGIVITAIVLIINNNISSLINEIPAYQKKFTNIIVHISEKYNVNLAQEIKDYVANINVTSVFSESALVITNIAGKIGLILIYVLFLLMEYRNFDRKLERMFTQKKNYKHTLTTINQIAHDINLYLKIKTFTSLLTGILSYIILVSIGVDFAEFWALLIFLLNYIPTVGSIIAVIFPVVISVVQFQSVFWFVLVLSLLVSVQVLVGNIIEPRLMGKSLNLSPLVIIISLAFWASVWGIIGAFLCIPITAILHLVFAKFEKTRPIAVALSARGGTD